MSLELRMKHPWTAKWPIDILSEHVIYAENMLRAIEEFLCGRCEHGVLFFRLKSEVIDGFPTLIVALDTHIQRGTAQWAALDAALTMQSIASNTAARLTAAQAALAAAIAHNALEAAKSAVENITVVEDENESTPDEENIKTITIYDEHSVHAIASMGESREKHVQDHAATLITRLRNDDGNRRLATIPNIEDLKRMDEQFPNFSEAYERIQQHVLLALKGDMILRLPPLLFVGPPGIGKTKFISTLANISHAPFKMINVSTLQSESVLAGSELHWGNTRPGEVFNLIVMGQYANPIFMLDELDKANKSMRTPLAALYHLLERETAMTFQDLSYPGFQFNASNINWFAAANDASLIDSALLSRFHVMDIAAPSRDEARKILQHMFEDLRASNAWGRHLVPTLSGEVLDALEKITGREAKRSLESACAYALSADRDALQADDIRIHTKGKRVGMGFT